MIVPKKWKIWLGLISHKCGNGLISTCGLLFSFSLIAFGGGFVPFMENEINPLSGSPQIIAIIICFFALYLVFVLTKWSSISENSEIVIYETKKFVEENPRFVKMPSKLIDKTRESEDPAELNDWLAKQKLYVEGRKKLDELEHKAYNIEHGITLCDLKTEIYHKKAELEKLNPQT